MHLLSIFLSLVAIATAATRIDPVFHEPIPGIVTYEKTAHIHFQRVIPDPIESLMATGETNCPSGSVNPFYCVLLHYLQNIEDALSNIITIDQSLRKPRSTMPTRRSPQCDKFTPLFPSLFMDSSDLKATIDTLKNCLEQGTLVTDSNGDYMSSFYGHYTDSMQNYDLYHNPSNPETERSSMITRELLNVAGFLHHFAERTRWEDSINRCKLHHFLPPLVIKEETLQGKLDELEAVVNAKGYEFAVPNTPETISTYWTLPTADCNINNGEILSILFSVPIKKSGSNWSLHKLSSIPFHAQYQNDNYTCHVPEFEEEQLIQFNAATNVSVVRRDGEISSSFLQFVETKPTSFLKDGSRTCSSRIIYGNISPIDSLYYCPVRCQIIPTSGSGLPDILVRMVKSDTYFIARTSPNRISVNVTCGIGSPTIIPLPVIGAVRLEIGCGCSFLVGEMKIEAGIPCNTEDPPVVNAEEVIPVDLDNKEFSNMIQYIKS
ncbi:hypothetical protein Fcan01_11019 [Folsomia candida]|uniref:Uncharacterized protein n=1 Tax=Folsomia candida TaxID=158441 RepID=A0A226EB48_FOLCA|nr:hypothetical protein Fcan01_11019 [Folsomia candida]